MLREEIGFDSFIFECYVHRLLEEECRLEKKIYAENRRNNLNVGYIYAPYIPIMDDVVISVGDSNSNGVAVWGDRTLTKSRYSLSQEQSIGRYLQQVQSDISLVNQILGVNGDLLK